MIDHDTLDALSEFVALANSASFLWRKLSDQPAIQGLARQQPEQLAMSLTDLLKRET